MTTLFGIIEYSMQNIGTKSEGHSALLKCNDGKEYTLYRTNCMPVDDTFFAPYHGKKVYVTGSVEEQTEHFCVTSISSDEPSGTIIQKNEK